MSTPINIIVGTQTVLDDVTQCDIKLTEGAFCFSVSISFDSKRFWNLCDPSSNFGVLRVKVAIGSASYQFLIEERSSDVSRTGVAFSIWGRSKQALLAVPYSKVITDTEDTDHLWQSSSSKKVAALVAHAVSNYCPYSVSVNWNVDDFDVRGNTFSANNESPIDVISSLASVIGAELVANINGSLSIESYSVGAGSSVKSYSDLGDIVMLSEAIDYPSGYNAVTIYGYDKNKDAGSGSATANVFMSVSRVDDEPIYEDTEHTVRIYYYYPGTAVIKDYSPNIHVGFAGRGRTKFTEHIILAWGHGNTSMPDLDGNTGVEGNESTPFEAKTVSYYVQYWDFAIRAYVEGSYQVAFYFDDKSAYQIYSFTAESLIDDPNVDQASKCEAIVLEKESPNTAVPGNTITMKLYSAECTVGETFNSSGTGVTPQGIQIAEQRTEEVLFTDGVAALAYPVSTMTCGLGADRVTYDYKVGDAEFHNQFVPTFAAGTNKLVVSGFIGDPKYYSIPATINYCTKYKRYTTVVPETWLSITFDIIFTFTECSGQVVLSLAIASVDEDETQKSITVTVEDYATDADIEDVSVWLDSIYKGLTNASGELNIDDVPVGDHTIKMTKTGYVDSDQDDLSNDTFTVS